jgi:hypothetical protein
MERERRERENTSFVHHTFEVALEHTEQETHLTAAAMSSD